jgi:hypothetical protein
MSSRLAKDIAKRASKGAGKVRHATISAAPIEGQSTIIEDAPARLPGGEIYIFYHLQTKQVVYSLKKNVKNSHALKQLPYNGKKTVPAALRKDLWTPLAKVDFYPVDTPQAAAAGLHAFRRLREYKKMHELQWPAELAMEEQDTTDSGKKSNPKPLSRKLRGRKLCDQKANSIADLAAALNAVTTPVVEPKLALDKDGKPLVDEDGNPTGQLEKDVELAKNAATGAIEEGGVIADAKEDAPVVTGAVEEGAVVGEAGEESSQAPVQVVEEEDAESVIGATVNWADMFDAEFAESWPKRVVHAQLPPIRHNRKNPVRIWTEEEVAPKESEQLDDPATLPKDEAGKVIL